MASKLFGIMNTEQTSENIFTYCILNNEDQLKASHQRLGGNILKENPDKVKMRRNFFVKRKKFS